MLLRWGFPRYLTAPVPLPALGSATLMKEEAGSQVAGGLQNRGLGAGPTGTCAVIRMVTWTSLCVATCPTGWSCVHKVLLGASVCEFCRGDVCVFPRVRSCLRLVCTCCVCTCGSWEQG